MYIYGKNIIKEAITSGRRVYEIIVDDKFNVQKVMLEGEIVC